MGTDLKSSTQSNLNEAINDVQRGARQLHAACLNLGANQNVQDTSAKVSLEKERGEKSDVEGELRSKVKEMLQMQADFEAEKAALNSKINELTVGLDRSTKQVNDKDRTINELSATLPQKESTRMDAGEEDEESLGKLRDEKMMIEQALRD